MPEEKPFYEDMYPENLGDPRQSNEEAELDIGGPAPLPNDQANSQELEQAVNNLTPEDVEQATHTLKSFKPNSDQWM